MTELRLRSKTPAAWAERVLAPANLPAFLADHAVCELQASVYALSLVGSYPGVPGLADALSALAAEELRHFRRASREARRLGAPLPTKRRNWYVSALRAACRSGARSRPRPRPPRRGAHRGGSHERFEVLLPRLTDARLAAFYGSLAEAEARHGPVYLDLAHAHAGAAAADRRLDEMLDVEAAALAAVRRREIAVHGAA